MKPGDLNRGEWYREGDHKLGIKKGNQKDEEWWPKGGNSKGGEPIEGNYKTETEQKHRLDDESRGHT